MFYLKELYDYFLEFYQNVRTLSQDFEDQNIKPSDLEAKLDHPRLYKLIVPKSIILKDDDE